MTTYRNPWHDPSKREYGPAIYECSADPVAYRGYLIYHRIAFDVVKNGLCVGCYHGINGARRFVDLLIDGSGEVADFHRQRVASYTSLACDSFSALVNGGDYRGTYCCTCGEKESAHRVAA